MPFCNSRQGTAWGTASLGVLVRQGGGVEGGGVGALFKVQDDLGCSSPLTGLLSCPHPRCRSTRCAAQRSWVNSCCCGSTRSAMRSSPKTPGTAAASASLPPMAPFSHFPCYQWMEGYCTIELRPGTGVSEAGAGLGFGSTCWEQQRRWGVGVVGCHRAQGVDSRAGVRVTATQGSQVGAF